MEELELSLKESSEVSSSESEKPPSLPKLDIQEDDESEGWISENILNDVDEDKEDILPANFAANCNIISRKNKLPSPRAAELVVRDL